MKSREHAGAFRPIRMLLIEDNPGDVRLALEAFREARLANPITVVTNGIEAVKLLRREGRYAEAARPDVILLDLNLPTLDGREVLQVVRCDPDLRGIPVAVLTTSCARDDFVQSCDLHADYYLVKPLTAGAVMAMMAGIPRFRLSVVQCLDEGEPALSGERG